MRSHQHTATFGWYGVPALVVLVLGWLSADVTADGASRQPHTSEAYTLAGTTMRLGWRDGRADPTQWDVHVPGVAGDAWISMLAPADSGVESRHLRLHGRLGGRPFEGAGEWRLFGNPVSAETLAFQLRLDDARLVLEQSFALADEEYHANVTVRLRNTNSATFTPDDADMLLLSLGPGLGDQRVAGLGYAEAMYAFVEPITRVAGRIRQLRPESLTEEAISWSGDEVEWLGLHARYFALLVSPAGPVQRPQVALPKSGATKYPIDHLPVLTWQLPLGDIASRAAAEWKFVVFSGPKSAQALGTGGHRFDAVLFPHLWQWLRWLCFGVLGLLTSIHIIAPDWGVSIILLAILVRLLMYPVARNAIASQKKFVEVQSRMRPELEIIKREFRGAEQSERILASYGRHGISPFTGLKPALIVLMQLPVLVALFHVLGSAYELRDAEFLWMETLAEPDKLFAFGISLPLVGDYFNALPVLMAMSTLAALKLSPPPAAGPPARRRQNAILVAMTLGFFALFYPFPAGMVLYWTAANVLHIVQHRWL